MILVVEKENRLFSLRNAKYHNVLIDLNHIHSYVIAIVNNRSLSENVPQRAKNGRKKRTGDAPLHIDLFEEIPVNCERRFDLGCHPSRTLVCEKVLESLRLLPSQESKS